MNRQSAGNKLIEVYNQTKSIQKTAEYYNVPYATMWARLKKAGRVSVKKKPVYSTNLNNQFFHKIDTEIKAYFLGFIEADGYIDKKRNRVAIRIQEKDVIILKRFCDAIGLPIKRINIIKKNVNSKYYSPNAQDCVEVAITNKEFVQPLLNVKTSLILNSIPEELKYHFIRGYFDGDGGIYYRNMKRSTKFSMSIMGSPGKDYILKYILNEFPDFKLYMDKRSNLPMLQSAKKSLIIEFRDRVYSDCIVYLPRKRQKFDLAKFLLQGSSTTTRETFVKNEDIV